MKIKIFCLFFIFSCFLHAQEKKSKIGLVLSGGGAKGFAHVSVLKEIEKAGLKIDYIGGTSMGAIIGGLYAAGYSANQIEEIIINVNFTNLLQDLTPRKSKSLFAKENTEKYVLTLPIKNGGIGLPEGLSHGQNIYNFLRTLVAPVDSIQDFSKLPIPFFCVATDVETGKGVVLESGSLAKAIRASGSFPTLLSPIEIDGKFYVDGGIADNFPVEEMRKKGMDIIIGSDVQGKLSKKKNLTSAVSILNQIMSYQIYKNSEEKKLKTDIYINPNLSNYTVVSFDKTVEIIKKGDSAALSKRIVLENLANTQQDYTFRKPIDTASKKYIIDRIHVKGSVNYNYRYITGKLQIREKDTLSHKILAERIDNLTATNNFSQISYQFKPLKESYQLIIDVKENESKASLGLGIHYDLLYKTGVLVNYSDKKMFSKNDVLSADLVIGDNIRYNVNYFIDNGFYWSFGFQSNYNAFKTGIRGIDNINFDRLQVRYRDFTNSIYVQTKFDKKFAFGIRVDYKSLKVSSETIQVNGSPQVFDDNDYLISELYLKLDTYDDKYFMTKGFFVDLGFKWYLWGTDRSRSFSQFSQFQGNFGYATTFWDKLTLKYQAEVGFDLGEVSSGTFDFILGGYNQNYINTFVPFYGYEIGSLSEQSFLKSTFELRYQLKKDHYASFLANFAKVSENVFQGGNLLKDRKSGYAFGYGLNSLIGPIEFKYSWSPDTNKNYWLINLGFWF